MKSEDVTIQQTARGLKITVPDNSTDTLVIVDLYRSPYDERSPQLVARVMMRGNFSGGRYRLHGTHPRRPVRATLSYEAPAISEEEYQRRRLLAFEAEGLPLPEEKMKPVPPEQEVTNIIQETERWLAAHRIQREHEEGQQCPACIIRRADAYNQIREALGV